MAKHLVMDRALEKMVATSKPFSKIDGAIYIHLNEEIIMKVELIYTSKLNQFDAVKCSIINKKFGLIDSNTIKFSAAFSPHIVAGKMTYNYIWKALKDFEWYLKEPASSEFIEMQKLINEYIEVFS